MSKFTNKKSLAEAISDFRSKGLSADKSQVGFVPTMGALHEGHLALVKSALSENHLVVVSIFINPTQFNNATDLDKYPRTLDDDLRLLETLDGHVMIYIPTIDDIYEEEIAASSYNFGGLEHQMEGKHRNGHFDGVGTVVSKLFDIVKPNKAYFGEKDFQQLQIIKKLVQLEKLPIEIVGCPIVREKSGLAMSSRNQRLNKEEQEEASLIYATLMEVREKFPTQSIEELNEFVSERFLNNSKIELEYFDIANEETLETATKKDPSVKHRAFIAAFMGEVRLIDNMPLN